MIENLPQAIAFLADRGARFVNRVNEYSFIGLYKNELALIMYKREFYKNFKYHFPNVKKVDGASFGWAQVMNKELLDKIVKDDVPYVIFITPDEKIYKCYASLFKNFAEKNMTIVPHLPGEVALPLDFFEAI